jgi:hypothetical protein
MTSGDRNEPAPSVVELVGVYHADGDLVGELRYWVGARLGTAHCALCDITHGMFRRRSQWTACTGQLSVPFTTYHLNDRPDDVAAASGGTTPCVLARTADDALVMVVDPAGLEACAGSPDALLAAISAGVDTAGLAPVGPVGAGP